VTLSTGLTICFAATMEMACVSMKPIQRGTRVPRVTTLLPDR
jgi:hypothetical protein